MIINKCAKQIYIRVITMILVSAAMILSITACFSIDSRNPGTLISFSYSFGSYFMGYWEYEIFERKGNIYFTAQGANGIDLNVASKVETYVLDDITKILQAYGMFSWNGFNKSAKNVDDGYSFHLVAKYEKGELEASGYHKYPWRYWDGHTALAEYLAELADTVELLKITDRNEITNISILLPENINIDISIKGEVINILYNYTNTIGYYSRDAVGRENYNEFIDFLVDYIARHIKDKPQMSFYYRTGNDGQITIKANNEEIGKVIEYWIYLNDNPDDEENEKLKEMLQIMSSHLEDME